jgi:hypothetical protein
VKTAEPGSNKARVALGRFSAVIVLAVMLSTLTPVIT